MENMRVNHLPSLTWNALHMNDSRVDSAVTAGEAYIEKDLSMGLEEGIRGEELPCFEKIETGMGPDMDALRKAGSMEPVQVTVPAGVKVQVLRLHIQRKPGESAFLPVEIAAEEDSEITVFCGRYRGKRRGWRYAGPAVPGRCEKKAPKCASYRCSC